MTSETFARLARRAVVEGGGMLCLTTWASWVFIGLCLLLVDLPPSMAHSLEDLENALKGREKYAQIVDRPAPVFTLRDAAQAPVRLADFRGRVVLLWFVYSRCPDVCPLHSEALAYLQEQINETPMRDLVQFITITTDPVHDTPDLIRDYGPTHGLDPVNWMMLTSDPKRPDATRELAEQYGLKFTTVKDGYQMHGVVTHLIDKSGQLRARYHGLKFDPTNMIVHINALTNDYH